MYYLSAAAMFRQENSWLSEWIQYHTAVGIEHFWLFSHEDDPTVSDKILTPYVESGIVETIHIASHDTLCRISQSDIQVYVLKEAIRLALGKTYWLALIDIDEFLLPRQDDNLRTVMQEYEDFSSLIVNWRIFGSNGFIKRPSTQINHLLRRAKDKYWFNKYVKSLVRPETIDLNLMTKYANISLPHMFVPKTGKIVNEQFEHIPTAEFRQNFIGEKLVINHYALRSFQDFWEVKVPRGRFYNIEICPQKYWDNYDRNEIFDDEISRRFGYSIQ
jgi:hypothetical protein